MARGTDLETNKADLSDDVIALKRDLANLRGDISKMASSLGGKAKDQVVAVRDSVQDSLKSSMSATEKCIQERPLTSVLVALGAGLLIGKIFSK
jgi:ElaB/YqjD/DUF883 family membrane-anchored ribosome-binding protein